MDFIETREDLQKLSKILHDNAWKYSKVRHEYGQMKWKVTILLAAKQDDEVYRKASLQKQTLLLLHQCPEDRKEEVHGYVRKMIELEQDYKALKLLVEATRTQISQLQSLMNFVERNE